MDPLFGFMDDLAQHHSEEGVSAGQDGGGVGEYTISYPTDQSNHYQLHQEHSVSQIQQGMDSTGNNSSQVVHVVSQDEQNEKKIYVIKLENFLKDEGNPNDTTVKFEAVQEEEMEEDRNDKAPESESELSEEEERKSDEEDDDPGPDPFAVISPESVMGMAQSVGVDLNEDDASELGCLAANKVRNAVLIAMQFAQNENSEGITVEHFLKAEEQLGSRGIGHESIFHETPFKYAGRFSVIDDGPEIDLNAAIRQENISELTIDDNIPILNVHHMIIHGSDEDKSALSVQQNEESRPDGFGSDSATADEEMGECDGMDASSAPKDLNEFTDEEDISHAMKQLTEDATIVDSKSNLALPNTDELPGKDESEIEQLAPEWISYLQVIAELVVGENYTDKSGCGVDPELKRISKDIRKNGAHPVFHIICDMFRDYVKDPAITKESIMNIVYIADALVSGSAKPSLTQMTDLGCVLIEILVLPPPCEVHQFLCHVFMEIMKNCNELLTWTCTYITEFLKGISEVPFDQVLTPFKSTMHGAVCLANGLEEMSIQIAHEFGWHQSVLTFSQSHSLIFDGQGNPPLTEDSYLEEEILKFYYNFLKNYVNLVPSQDLARIRECVVSMYGERFNSFSPSTAPTITVAHSCNELVKTNQTTPKRTRCVYQKIVYKNNEVVVPLRKVFK